MNTSVVRFHETVARRALGVATLTAIMVVAAVGQARAGECLTSAAAGTSLTCSTNADSLTVSGVTVTEILNDDCGGATNSFTFNGSIEVRAGLAPRNNIGFYVATTGDSALTGGDCSFYSITPDCPKYDGTAVSIPVSGLTVKCSNSDGNAFYDVPVCDAYGGGKNGSCGIPNAAGKCDCSSVNTTFEVPHCDTNADCTVDDGNFCTSNVCLGLGQPGADFFGCGNANNTLPCDDGEFCNGTETCGGGTCNSAGDPCVGGGECGHCNEQADNCFDPAGTVCRASTGVCDALEACTGSSASCPADSFVPSTVECRADAGACDLAESCTGSSADCPADELEPDDTSCDDGSFCNGVDKCSAGQCIHSGDPCAGGDVCANACNEDVDNCFVTAGTVCRPADGECDSAEVCTGVSASCPGDGFASPDKVCRPADGPCDSAESCPGDGKLCPSDEKRLAGTECRPVGSPCDPDGEFCDGSSNACPENGFADAGVPCRPSAGVCDPAEACSGSSGDCPADGKSTDVCRSSAGFCDIAESCDGEHDDCPADTKSVAVCRTASGVCDTEESCNGTDSDCPADLVAVQGVTCRSSGGVCDVAEACDGTAKTCPEEAFVSGTTCRASTGVCDPAETCTGSAAACPAELFSPSSAICRATTGVCDLVEQCTGSSGACPADAFVEATHVCRPSGGTCDVDEKCTGSSGACPVDGFVPSSTVCRSAVGVCDVAEHCTGSTIACPSDALLTATTTCRSATGVCDSAELCNGSDVDCPDDAVLAESVVCRGSGGICDLAENCDGTGKDCPNDLVQDAAHVCRPKVVAADGTSCDVAETCDGSLKGCPANAFIAKNQTCRGFEQQDEGCDFAEVCSGNSDACPADAVQSEGLECYKNANHAYRDACDGNGKCGTLLRPGAACESSDQCAGAGDAVCSGQGLCRDGVCMSVPDETRDDTLCAGKENCQCEVDQPDAEDCGADGTSPSCSCGDANGDGVLTVDDADYIEAYLRNEVASCPPCACDVETAADFKAGEAGHHRDGVIDAHDAASIRAAAKGRKKLVCGTCFHCFNETTDRWASEPEFVQDGSKVVLRPKKESGKNCGSKSGCGKCASGTGLDNTCDRDADCESGVCAQLEGKYCRSKAPESVLTPCQSDDDCSGGKCETRKTCRFRESFQLDVRLDPALNEKIGRLNFAVPLDGYELTASGPASRCSNLQLADNVVGRLDYNRVGNGLFSQSGPMLCAGGENNGNECSSNSDCPATEDGSPDRECKAVQQFCLGGDNNTEACTSNSDCPRGECSFQPAYLASEVGPIPPLKNGSLAAACGCFQRLSETQADLDAPAVIANPSSLAGSVDVRGQDLSESLASALVLCTTLRYQDHEKKEQPATCYRIHHTQAGDEAQPVGHCVLTASNEDGWCEENSQCKDGNCNMQMPAPKVGYCESPEGRVGDLCDTDGDCGTGGRCTAFCRN